MGRARDHLLSDGFGWRTGPRLARAGLDVVKPVQCDSATGGRPNPCLRSEDTANHVDDADLN
jgi:hypothetical protein